MKRELDLAEISDGRLYRGDDVVKLDTGGCPGCSACCRGMEETIVLDPYDIWMLNRKAGLSFESLLASHAELRVIDGLVLPVLAADSNSDACTFLTVNGRCGVHDARPGICRLFPLGRYYEGGDFRYYLQKNECRKTRTKVRIRKWMDLPDFPKYEEFIRNWHGFLLRLEAFLAESDETLRKAACMYLLKAFYLAEWDVRQDFYGQYAEKRTSADRHFGFA